MAGFFLGLAGLLLGISLGLCPWEFPRISPASPQKTLSITPVVLGLTQSLPLIGLQRQPGCLEQIWIAALTALWLPPAPPTLQQAIPELLYGPAPQIDQINTC